jgi:hypothetical protein
MYVLASLSSGKTVNTSKYVSYVWQRDNQGPLLTFFSCFGAPAQHNGKVKVESNDRTHFRVELKFFGLTHQPPLWVQVSMARVG